jgi:anti-sigma B factor antagonist
LTAYPSSSPSKPKILRKIAERADFGPLNGRIADVCPGFPRGRLARALEPGQVELEREGDGPCVVRLVGEHDLNTAASLRERLGTAVNEGRGIVVDLSATDFIDSSILGAILEARQQATDNGSGFAIIGGGGEPVERVLEVTGLKQALPIRSSRDEAVELARGAPPGGCGSR